MSAPLTSAAIALDNPLFEAICGWPFADPFVSRILNEDIPQRVQFGNARIWVYRDSPGNLVGFGTLDICTDYSEYTNGQPHPYIPLLATNPTAQGKGYGTAIVNHLVAEAAFLAIRGRCHDELYLDVYTASEGAIHVYRKCGFQEVTLEPKLDPRENDRPYIIMAKKVSVAPS
jgi:ribosomal protein S18 acetylase RimI-like enzyme